MPAWEMLKAGWTVRDDFLTIDLRSFFERLDVVRVPVTVSDDIMDGTPVISGTRIPVHDVAAAMAAGVSVKELLPDYPPLTPENLELEVLHADANPLRGRPKPLMSRLPKGTRIVSEHRVPRRRTG